MRGPSITATFCARTLRRNQTAAETKLWAALRNRQLDDVKFVRQEAIGPYTADFACRKAKLVIELDGVTHDMPDEMLHDERRTAYLAGLGYRVVRFRNEEILGDLDPVLDAIRKYLT